MLAVAAETQLAGVVSQVDNELVWPMNDLGIGQQQVLREELILCIM